MTEENQNVNVAAPGIVYKSPDDIETYITIDDCDRGIKDFMSAATADPSGHPYTNKRGHPLQEDYRKHITQLHQKRAELRSANGEESFSDIAIRERNEKVQEKQDMTTRLAQAEMDELVKLGLEKAEIPGDVTDNIVQLLRAQKLYLMASKDTRQSFMFHPKKQQADSIFRKIAHKLGVSDEIVSTDIARRDVAKDREDKYAASQRMLEWLLQDERKQANESARMKQEIQNRVTN